MSDGGRKERTDPVGSHKAPGSGTWHLRLHHPSCYPIPTPRPPPGQPLPTRSTLAPKVTLRGQHPCQCCREGLPSSATCRRAHMSPVSWTQSPQDRTPGAFWWPMDHCDPVLRTRPRKASGQRRHSSLEQPSGNQPQLTLGETGYSEAKPHQTSEGSPEWPTSRSLPGSWPTQEAFRPPRVLSEPPSLGVHAVHPVKSEVTRDRKEKGIKENFATWANFLRGCPVHHS